MCRPGAVAAVACLVALLLVTGVPRALAQPGMTTPVELVGVDIVEKLGEEVALDVTLMNDAGDMVRVADYFNDGPRARTGDGRGKPAILALVYYDCPIVCALTMERLRRGMNRIEYIVGEDFNVLVVSIDHTNTTDMALEQKLASLLAYNKPRTDRVDAGWAYHTATAGNSRRLADSVGFKYNFIADAGEYAHAPAIMILTPEGKVARYFYGIDYDTRASEIQLALVEASRGEISATLMDRLILFCFHYDPTKGSYTLQARRVMQIGGVLSMLGIAGLVMILRGQEKRRSRRRAARAAKAGSEAGFPLPPRAAEASARRGDADGTASSLSNSPAVSDSAADSAAGTAAGSGASVAPMSRAGLPQSSLSASSSPGPRHPARSRPARPDSTFRRPNFPTST